jgi:hypothetical protein
MPGAVRRMAAEVGGREFRASVLAVLCALAGGCAAVQPPAPPALAPPLPDAATLAQAIERQRLARTSLRALARVKYSGPEETGRARQVVLVERPARLRFEVLSAFGSVFVLTADNGTLAAYVPKESTVYRGRASRRNLERYARVDLSVPDAVELLLGTPPARDGRNAVVSFEAASDSIALWREVEDGAQVVWFNRALQPVATEERGADGTARWRARFGAFAADHAELPARIAIELPADRRIELELSEIEVNPVLAGPLFTFVTPPGAHDVLLDAPGAES